MIHDYRVHDHPAYETQIRLRTLENEVKDYKFMSHLMYDTIKKMVENILDEDTASALQLGAAIMNDYEETVNGQ